MTGKSQVGLDRFAEAIISRLGFCVHRHNQDQVCQVLANCLVRSKCVDVEQYIARFQDPKFASDEMLEIALELTVPETYFFRHPEQFHAFVQAVLPDLIEARKSIRQLNVLSAGCASGEEAYSLAVAMSGVSDLAGWNIRIWGIDVNPQLLHKARQGRYTQWSLRGVSEAHRGTHFRLEGQAYVLDSRFKSVVRFESRNLIDEDPTFWRPEFFDAAFCRNVMIYFSPEAIRAVVGRLTDSLARGGFLFLGPSETLRGVSQEFHLRHTQGAFYYQRRLENERATLPALAPPGASVRPAVPDALEQDDKTWVSAIAGSSSRIAAMAGRSAGQQPQQASAPAQAMPTAGGLADLLELVSQERFEDALKAISQLPREVAADPDAMLLEAIVLANKGDLPQAEQVCQRLLTMDSLRPGVHYLMAVCQERRGDHLSAAERDQTAIYLDPDFAMPHLHLGLLAKRLGDRETARRELGEAIVLLAREDASRILMFGGGFSREALIRSCQAQLDRCGGDR